MDRFAVPGVAVATVENGRIGWSRGYGVTRAGSDAVVGTDTVFEAASLGKPVFAYLVLKLAEEGIMELDASIGSYFRAPDFMNDPAVDAITPRIVLSHRTGLANWRPPREPDRLRFTPGTAFSYSGEAYVRLQRAVETAAGRPFNELVTSRLFRPWQMASSSYIWRADFDAIAAEGHDAAKTPVRTRLWGYSPDKPSGPRLPPGAEPPPVFAVPNAAASLYCSVADYARFLSGVLAPAAPDAAHLGAASLKAMASAAVKVKDDIWWGLGWGGASIRGASHIWQWGNNNVYQSFVTGSPDTGSGLVILTNSANGLRLCREAVAAFIGADHPAFNWDRVLRPAPIPM